MKKIIIVLTILVSGFLFSGCGEKSITSTGENVNVEKIGVLQAKAGEEFLLSTDQGVINVNSLKVDLNTFMKKKIKINGQFSGSTLYADSVTEQ